MDVKELYENYQELLNKDITLSGWVRTNRAQKDIGFINFHDGTCFQGVQLVYDDKTSDFSKISALNNGASVTVSGTLVKSPKEKQPFELHVKKIILEGDCPSDYPLQPKDHSREFLREIAYLRPRANLFQAVYRIRNVASYAIHNYFHLHNYVHVASPIITGNDGEGAGEMFQVTTLPLGKEPNYENDFFGKKVGLTVTGQLEAETFALAFKKAYTFGPSFRAEHSNTKTHAAEFWMLEPEIAFCDLYGLMDIEEDMLKYIIKYVLDNAKDEIAFCDRYVENGLIEKLNHVINSKAIRISYTDAINELIKSKKKFSVPVKWGNDIGAEHEKYLTQELYKSPVFIYDWPKDIKAFYMKINDDNKTVRGVDLLVPLGGELMGGSERETDLTKLKKRMKELNVSEKGLEWYLDLRKYGGCTHSGFGMGFDRLLIYLTGVDNIRDTIPYPRTVGNCEY